MAHNINLFEKYFFPLLAGICSIAAMRDPQTHEHPYYFGAQILLLGSMFFGNYLLEQNVPFEQQFRIVAARPAAAAAVAAAAPVRALAPRPVAAAAAAAPVRPLARRNTEDRPARRTPLYDGVNFQMILRGIPEFSAPAARIGEEIDPISQDIIDPDYRIELESGNVFDARQLLLAILAMPKMMDPTHGPVLQNPVTRLPLTTRDIADICERFLIDPRLFLNLWDTASELVSDQLLATAEHPEALLETQDDIIGNAERTFRTESALELIKSMSPELAAIIQSLRSQ